MTTSTDGVAYPKLFKRIVTELCELVGFKTPELLLTGEKLRIDDYTISLIHDESYSQSELFVYIDMGPFKGPDKEGAYKALLKINFDLLAGSRGAISMHPQTDHIFYAFRYQLEVSSTGRKLLDTLLRFIRDVGVETLNLSMEAPGTSTASSTAGRAKLDRFIKDDTLNNRETEPVQPCK